MIDHFAVKREQKKRMAEAYRKYVQSFMGKRAMFTKELILMWRGTLCSKEHHKVQNAKI